MKKIDLHMHSSYSDDGDLTPKEILKRAEKIGMTHIAITDHNSVYGVEEALEYATEHNLTIIPGIEIDCNYNGKDLHVIGYGIDYKNDVFEKIRMNVLEDEQRLGAKKLQLLKENTDLIFDEEKVINKAINGIITGEIIGEVVLEEPRNRNNPLLEGYFDGGVKTDMPTVHFYWDFCSQGKVGYVKMNFPKMEEVIEIIKKTGGVSILAHPGNNLKNSPELIYEIIEKGIDGIEVYSSYHTPEVSEKYYKIAKENNLLITCGSDFHGKHKPQIEIGEFGQKINFDEILNNVIIK